MDVALIDYYANHGKSFLHSAAPPSKLLFTALVITSVVITEEFYLLLAIYLALVSLAVWTRLSAVKIISIAAYPAIFALLFVIATWDGSLLRAGVVMLKALTSALTMVILIVTTPYPDVFKTLKPVLPSIIHDGLYLTYRSLFVLLEMTDDLVKGLKVRGGLTKRKYIRNIANFSSGIGLVLIKGFDITEKYYGVMKVRGYTGKIASNNNSGRLSTDDIAAVAFGIVIFSLSLGIKLQGSIDQPGLYALIIAAIILVISIAYVAKEGR
jgi:cobalt/nickel transport system permease protein